MLFCFVQLKKVDVTVYSCLLSCIVQLEKDKAELATQLRNTMEKLQELSTRSTEASSSSELLVLREEQVKAYKEDFESERRDRERAQSRLADVEMELEIVKREVRGKANRNFLMSKNVR